MTYAEELREVADELVRVSRLPATAALREMSRLLDFADPAGVPARVRAAKRMAAETALAEVGGTQVALARAVGLSEQAVSRALSSGTRHPR